MNSDELVQLLQKSFHVTLGATTALVEVIQDPQKREQNLSKLRLEIDELLQEWSTNAKTTELEARNFVDGVLDQIRGQTNSNVSSPVESETNPSSTISKTQLDLQELTAQLAAIRTELEQLRSQSSNESTTAKKQT